MTGLEFLLAKIKEAEQTKFKTPVFGTMSLLQLERIATDLDYVYSSMPYKIYLQTDHWKHFRKKALENAHYSCQLCNNTKRLEVHHRTYQNRGCETFLDVIVLCRDCHAKFHGKLAK